MWHKKCIKLKILFFSLEIPAGPSDHVELVSLIFFRLAVVESVAPARNQGKAMDLREEDVFLVKGEILLWAVVQQEPEPVHSEVRTELIWWEEEMTQWKPAMLSC